MSGDGLEYQVRSVNRAVDILELLALQPDRTLTQLAEALEIPKSTCFNIISTLSARSLLTQDPATGRFRLGVTAIRLGGACLQQLDVRTVARPLMERLVSASRETSILAVLQEPELDVIYIDKVDSPSSVALTSELGRRDPAYCTALGKALLADLPPEQLERYIRTAPRKTHTARTITDATELRQVLQQVHREGYAVNHAELDNEGWGIACPIHDHTGKTVAAISVAGPVHRLTDARMPDLIKLVMVTAAEISASLGATARV